MRFVALVLAQVLVLGFSSVALAGTWEEDSGRANTCFVQINRDPMFESLSTKLAFGQAPSLTQLENDDLATDADIRGLRLRADRVRPCREMMLAAVKAHHPYALSAHEVLFLQFDIVYLHLVKRRITFGNAARLYHEAWLEFTAKWEQYARLTTEQQRQEQSNRDRQLAEQARRLQESIDRLPPGRLTTCHWSASMLVCNTL